MAVPLKAGETVAGDYVLQRPIGEGGMGTVWSAHRVEDGERVALKFIKKDVTPALRKRFRREAMAASAVQHPAVVDVLEVRELDDGAPMMVMEFLTGETLGEKLDREGPLEPSTFAEIMLPVVGAVGTAHAAGIVHRDLKPENIFLVRQENGTADEQLCVKVLDFGIAKLTTPRDVTQNASLTETGSMLGTPYYMAPEQVFGERDIDHRADTWALGIIFYQALSGVLPTHAPNVGQVLKMILQRTIYPLREAAPDVPADIGAMVDRMLARPRDERPADLREVHALLSRYTTMDAPSFAAPAAPAEAVEAVEAAEAAEVRESVESLEQADTVSVDRAVAVDRLDEESLDTPLALSRSEQRAHGSAARLVAAAVLVLAAGGVWWSSRPDEPSIEAMRLRLPMGQAGSATAPVVASSVSTVASTTTSSSPAVVVEQRPQPRARPSISWSLPVAKTPSATTAVTAATSTAPPPPAPQLVPPAATKAEPDDPDEDLTPRENW